MGEYLDLPRIVIGIIVDYSYIAYRCLRISDDIYNGTIVTHSETSVARFKVIDHKPMAHILYNSNKAPF